MPFGQLVLGPPGSGKSTYCHGMYQFLCAIGRKPSVVNLDPANDKTVYPCSLDIRDFIRLEDIMESESLGPNGGLMYALEEMENSLDEFVNQVKSIGDREYVIFDCPGQVELYTHHNAMKTIFKTLEKQLDFRLVVVHLVDSYYITSPSQYISILLLSLRSMLQIDLPHINVLSKIDLIKNYGELPFNLDYYTEVQDLSYMFPLVEKESPSLLGQKYAKLTEAIADVVEDFGLVAFEVLAVEDKQSMISLLSVIDKATGYLFGSTEIGGDAVWVEATRQGGYLSAAVDIQERWIDYKDEYEKAAGKHDHDGEFQDSEGYGPDAADAADADTSQTNEEREWQEAMEQWEREHGKKATK
ncbi:Gpn2p [Sugiyamaella lignohabitans]|uniref:GPN-loop GTPase 2 n=1 Tax=Sugiyamaella lignohabitans TaxID=796027 RepID=A0A167F9Y4_9ASCO|nr:Gpn2p [Sugiyamaella lignohabitans]ANB15013.1 Gpn2p [Sugiyamaella lignohabitans]